MANSTCDLRIFSINLQHSITAVSSLISREIAVKADVNINLSTQNRKNTNKQGNGDFIYCIQEPYLGKKERPMGFPRGAKLYYTGNSPRAAIWSSLDLFPLLEFSDRDMMVANLDSAKICFAAVYLDVLDIQVIKPKMNQLLDYCRRQDLHLIMNVDTNAHSALWGSDETNPRGDVIEDFILQQDLVVANIGAIPTYERVNCATIIDVTLTLGLEDAIHHWRVVRDVIASDHNLIAFELSVVEPVRATVRNYNQANWSKFQRFMSKPWSPPPSWSSDVLDREVGRLEKDIHWALDKACPRKTVRTSLQTVNWWNATVAAAQQTWKRATKVAKIQQTNEAWLHSKEMRNDYKRVMRKAKRQSYQEYCAKIESAEGMSYLMKALQRGASKVLGQVKKTDGTLTTSMRSTLAALFREHFPGCTPSIANARAMASGT